MKQISSNTVELADAFIFPVTGMPRLLRCRCRDCEKTWELKQIHKTLPAHVVFRKARREGWLVSPGKKPRCPKHAVDPAHYKSVPFNNPPPAEVHQPLKRESLMSTAATAAVNSQTTPNMKLVRQAIALLDDHFDEEAHRYRPGWSDEKIAKETGLHIVQVAKIRCEAGFGELADDPEMVKLRDDIAAHELACEELHKTSKALSVRVESFIAARKLAR
jgi:hypothetical protein